MIFPVGRLKLLGLLVNGHDTPLLSDAITRLSDKKYFWLNMDSRELTTLSCR
jgi:hypothetical protein